MAIVLAPRANATFSFAGFLPTKQDPTTAATRKAVPGKSAAKRRVNTRNDGNVEYDPGHWSRPKRKTRLFALSTEEVVFDLRGTATANLTPRIVLCVSRRGQGRSLSL